MNNQNTNAVPRVLVSFLVVWFGGWSAGCIHRLAATALIAVLTLGFAVTLIVRAGEERP